MSSLLQRVLSWYPNKTLYRRTSSLSGKPLVSVYPDSWHGPVVSHDEWFSDSFRASEVAYRSGIPFFTQFAELQAISPVVTLLSSRQENAEYCHDCEGLKNCYMVFDSLNCRDVLYSARIYDSNDCVDCYWTMKSEIIYDSVYMFSCFDCKCCFNCHDCSDSAFLFDCRNCQHCFMSSGLRNQRYYLFNENVGKEKYESFMASVPYGEYSQLLTLKQQFRSMLATSLWPPAFNENVEDCSGNYLKNCKDCTDVFESFDLRDCSNSFQCAMGSDIHNSFMCNDRVELCRNCVATGIQSYNTFACAFTWHCHDMEFCYLCLDCSHCFGCWGLKNRQYCILNREYPPDEYSKIVEALRRELAGVEFFPDTLNPFKYEDTIAADFFSPDEKDLFKAECAAATSGIVKPELIRNCVITEKPFRLTEAEIAFYSPHGLPMPVVCPQIRYRQKIQIMDTSFAPTWIPGSDPSPKCYYNHPETKRVVTEREYLSSRY